MNYYLVTVLDKFPIPMAIGLCLPKECTLADVEGFKPTLLKGIQAAMPNIVEGVKGFDHLDTNVTLEDLRIVDPRAENDQVTKVTKGSIFFICLASTICLTVFVSTGIVWKQRQDEI